MHFYTLEREQRVPMRIEEVFDFFSRPENLQNITPPWLDFCILNPPGELSPGSLIQYRLRWRKVIPLRWTSEISEWNPPHGFVDRQIAGPYAMWNHAHSFSSEGAETLIRDRVTYALPFGWIGRVAHRLWVRRDVGRIFDFRAQALRQHFHAEQSVPFRSS